MCRAYGAPAAPPRVVISKTGILTHAWDENVDGHNHSGEVYIGHPRRKTDTPFGRRTMEANPRRRLLAHRNRPPIEPEPALPHSMSTTPPEAVLVGGRVEFIDLFGESSGSSPEGVDSHLLECRT